MIKFRNILSESLIIKQWQIKPDECWAVLGRNGSGKQLLAQLITGRLKPAAGQFTTTFSHIALLSFEQQQALYENELRIDDSDFMDHLDPGTTVRQLLALEAGIPEELAFLRLEGILDRGYRLLSSGESRKALLAQALLNVPDLLILDEPYDSLDLQSKHDLSRFFQALLEKGKTQLLFLLNSREEVFPWHSHLAIMEKGEIIAQGTREEIKEDAEIIALLSFDKNKLPAWPEAFPTPPLPEDIVELVNGRVAYHSAYGESLIFERVNLRVSPGEHTLISGPNGSGKSTLLGLISGDHPQCYGNQLTVLGFKRGSGESIWQLKKQIGIVSPELHRSHRASGNALHIVLSGFFDSIGLYEETSQTQQKHTRLWLELVGLSEKLASSFKQLSYGEQRLVLIARALVKQPALLILDEPTQGLDDVNRHRLLYFLEHLASQQHTTIIMASHRQDERLGIFKQFVNL